MTERKKRPRPVHRPADFGLEPLESDDDLFRWFLLVFMLGKPIQSTVAVKTWKVFINHGLTNPWAILDLPEAKLTSYLRAGGYTRYQHVMTRSLRICMDQLIKDYDGSLMYALSLAETPEELSKILQKFHGVGPKTAEIFMREIDEYFDRWL